MKKLNSIMHKVYPVLGSLLTVVAITLTVKPASIFGFHQPKVPKYIK